MSDTPRTDAIVHGRICYGETANDMKVIEAFARQLERELAAKNAEADTARLDWLLQDIELNLFFADREEIDAAMKEASQ